MVDDTVYFLSTNIKSEAYILVALLNHSLVQDFLSSITFIGNKRPYTKEILQRINISKVLEHVTLEEMNQVLLANGYTYKVSHEEYHCFSEKIYIPSIF